MIKNSNRVRFLPNAITLLGLAAALTAYQHAAKADYRFTLLFFAAAALCDFMDGAVARLLNAGSELGAQLDSLSDLVSFGVAPALTVYVWSGNKNNMIWGACLVYIAAMALRLARFNLLLEKEDSRPFTKYFFMGVAAPGGALMILLPMVSELVFGQGWWSTPPTICLWIILCALLLVSKVPTVSLKRITVPPSLIPVALVLLIAVAAGAFNSPVETFWALELAYVLFIPISGFIYVWMSRKPEEWDGPDEDEQW
ncbi:MAG: phosphatidylcholine/phosphatidylserine synthase [Micrococcaceae bacterium]